MIRRLLRTAFLTAALGVLPAAAFAGTGAGQGTYELRDGVAVISRSEAEAIAADHRKVLRDARAVPYSKNGVVLGMRLFHIQPNSFWAKLGLIEGDILMELDGKPFIPEDLEPLVEALRNLSRPHEFKVDRNRDIKVVKFQAEAAAGGPS